MTVAEKYPTLSVVVPLYNRLMDHLELWMRDMTQPGESLHNSSVAAYAKIKDYYNVTSDCYTISTILDPRFNISFYRKSQGKSQELADEIIKIVENIYVVNYRPDVDAQSAPLEKVNTPGLSFIFELIGNEPQTAIDYRHEFQMYIMEPVLRGEATDVLMWWKSNSVKYPNLSRMARDYLAIPGTSASLNDYFQVEKN